MRQGPRTHKPVDLTMVPPVHNRPGLGQPRMMDCLPPGLGLECMLPQNLSIAHGRTPAGTVDTIVTVRPRDAPNAKLSSSSVRFIACAANVLISYLWHVSHREHNRLMHALHGNGVITKLYTNDLPKLSVSAHSVEDFITWQIDLRSWATQAGIEPLIFGPLPEGVSDADRDEALRYICHAVEDKNLKSAVALAGQQDNGGAPDGMMWLQAEFLQGVATQPALNNILNSMAMQSTESFVAFKARFVEIVTVLDPRPDDVILCTKFISAVKRHFGSSFDDCISGASAVNDQTNFNAYTQLFVRLCTQKQAREPVISTHQTEYSALTARLDALTAAMESSKPYRTNERGGVRDQGGRGGRTNGPNGGGGRSNLGKGGGSGGRNNDSRRGFDRKRDDSKKELCTNCGARHSGKCNKPPAKCTFTLPNGEKCGKNHLEQFCFYKNPEGCKDPRIKALILKRLADMRTASASAHQTDTQDAYEIYMCHPVDMDLAEQGFETFHDSTAETRSSNTTAGSVEPMHDAPVPHSHAVDDPPGLIPLIIAFEAWRQHSEIAAQEQGMLLSQSCSGKEAPGAPRKSLAPDRSILDSGLAPRSLTFSPNTNVPMGVAWDTAGTPSTTTAPLGMANGGEALHDNPEEQEFLCAMADINANLWAVAQRKEKQAPRDSKAFQTMPRGIPHYVLKWRRWILQHLLGALPASPILDLVPVDLIVQMTIDDEMAYIHSRMARTRDLQTRQYKSMLRSGYSKLTALSFSITAHPTVIFDKLTGAEEAYKLRTENVPSVCLLQDGSVGSTDVFLSDTDRHHHLIIDTGATGHLVCDRTCLVQYRYAFARAMLSVSLRVSGRLLLSFATSVGTSTHSPALLFLRRSLKPIYSLLRATGMTTAPKLFSTMSSTSSLPTGRRSLLSSSITPTASRTRPHMPPPVWWKLTPPTWRLRLARPLLASGTTASATRPIP